MSEDTKIRFLFDAKTVGKRLKWKDIKKVRKFRHLKEQGNDIDDEFLEQLQVLACRFMANDSGEYLPLEAAFDIFDELSRDEALDALEKFTQVFQESTIPNGNGRQSESTSEVNSPTPPTSPTGLAS